MQAQALVISISFLCRQLLYLCLSRQREAIQEDKNHGGVKDKKMYV